MFESLKITLLGFSALKRVGAFLLLLGMVAGLFFGWLALHDSGVANEAKQGQRIEITKQTGVTENKEIVADENIKNDVAGKSADELADSLQSDCRDCGSESRVRVQGKIGDYGIQERSVDDRNGKADRYREPDTETALLKAEINNVNDSECPAETMVMLRIAFPDVLDWIYVCDDNDNCQCEESF